MKVNNSLVNQEKKVTEFEVNGETIKLSPSIIKKYLVNGNGDISDQEINFFTALCKGRKLNPFLKEVHLIKYGSQPAQMVVGKDALLKRAILNPQYNGMKSGVWVVNLNGEVEKREGAIVLNGKEELIGAWCDVYRKDWTNPSSIDVNFEEYVGKKSNGEVNSQWKGKPVTMIVKVAKAQALREAFVEELGGMYEAEELGIDLNNKESDVEIEKNEVQEVVEEAKNKFVKQEIEEVEEAVEVEKPKQKSINDDDFPF